MIILLEGLDRCGKTTQCEKIVSAIANQYNGITTVRKYSAFKKLKNCEEFSKLFYKDYFDKILEWKDRDELEYDVNTDGGKYKRDNVLILDRGHISESVYSGLYRNYDGYYVFGKDYELRLSERSDIYLLTFIDDADAVCAREDGNSAASDRESKLREIKAFVDATDKSCIRHKKVINIYSKTIDEVFTEISTFLELS